MGAVLPPGTRASEISFVCSKEADLPQDQARISPEERQGEERRREEGQGARGGRRGVESLEVPE